MRRLIALLTLITGVTLTHAANNTASVQVNVTAKIVESAKVETKAIDKTKCAITLNDVEDEYGKLERTVIVSSKAKIEKDKNDLYVLNLSDVQEENIVVLTVINS